MGESANVFLSYKAEDRARLTPFVAALEAEGFAIWWDAHIGGGTSWRQDIQEHLDGARCVIVAWSKRSVGPEGEFVRDEATHARRRGTYLPICIDPVTPPLGFGEVQALPLIRWKGDRRDPRFRALVEAVRARIDGTAQPAAIAHSEPRVSRRAVMAGGAGAAVLAAGAGGWFLLAPEAASAQGIAVLPFANLSGDPAQAYFSDGLAEELRGALGRTGKLRIIGRTSSEMMRDVDAVEACRKLGVGSVLTGSVRRSPSTIRISAQLIDGKDGTQRWSESYDRAAGDVLKVQTDIAEQVASALSIHLGQAGRKALIAGGTDNPAAQELYLKAVALNRLAYDEEAFRRVVGLLDAAIVLDADYGDSYSLKSIALANTAILAESPAISAAALRDAEAAGRKSIAIAPNSALGYNALWAVATNKLDFKQGLMLIQRSVAIQENAPRLANLALELSYQGRNDEAFRANARAQELDPLDFRIVLRRAEISFAARHYEQAIAAQRDYNTRAPENARDRQITADSLTLLGRESEALKVYAEIPTEFRHYGEAIAHARLGDRAQSDAAFKRFRADGNDTLHVRYAAVHAQRGEVDQAFAELDRAWTFRNVELATLRIDPFLDPIRRDGRFKLMEQRLGMSD